MDFLEVEGDGQSAKIAVLGSVISIIGQSISTYAAAMAIEEEKNGSDFENSSNELKK